MIKIKNYLLNLYRNTTESIAFYPTLISIGFFALSIVAINLRDLGVTEYLIKNFPYLVLSDADTSRTLLSTFIGGLLSLVVFSFSMVMLLLSQASANYSPRLLPGLISEKKHQIVLGTYLGTIIYDIFVLINISPNADAYQLPGFAILLGISAGIFCMGMFVYFIHSISQEIQIGNILINIFNTTRTRLLHQDAIEENHGHRDFPELENGYIIKSTHSGYFQGVNEKTLIQLSEEHDMIIRILPIKGMFVLNAVPAVCIDREVKDEIKGLILSCLRFDQNERVEDNYVLGFKQITEIAVKAMSPGINDPGTAVSALDYLSELFAIRMTLNDEEYLTDTKGKLRISLNIIKFEHLIYNVLAPIRQYSKHDILVMQKVILMLNYLVEQPVEKESFTEFIKYNIQLVMDDARSDIHNKTDLMVLNAMVQED